MNVKYENDIAFCDCTPVSIDEHVAMVYGRNSYICVDNVLCDINERRKYRPNYPFFVFDMLSITSVGRYVFGLFVDSINEWHVILKSLEYLRKTIRFYHNSMTSILEIRKNGVIYLPMICNSPNVEQIIWIKCTNPNVIILDNQYDRLALYFFDDTADAIAADKKDIETREMILMRSNLHAVKKFTDAKFDF
jgi:hypothetical protein